MIRLISFLRRKPGTTHDEFLAHWFGVHGPLIAASSAATYVRRYEQHPASWPSDPAATEPPWDGVTIQEFDSVDSFWAHVREPDFPDMQADIARFLDTGDLPWLLVDEANVVIGGSGATEGDIR